MTQLMQQIAALTQDQKLRLIQFLTEELVHPTAHRPLGFYLDASADLEPHITPLSTDQKQQLIKSTINAL